MLDATFEYNFEALALSGDDKTLVFATTVDKERCLLGLDVMSREVIFTLTSDIHAEGVSKLEFINDDLGDQAQILSVGSKRSKDLAIWDLETETMRFSLNLDGYPDVVKVMSELYTVQ